MSNETDKLDDSAPDDASPSAPAGAENGETDPSAGSRRSDGADESVEAGAIAADDADQAAGEPADGAPAADDGADRSAREQDLDELFLSPDDDAESVVEVNCDDSTNPPAESDDDGPAQSDDERAALADRVEAAEQDRDEFKERWMRAAADLDNLRKRAKREKKEQRKYGNDKLAVELLPAIDNLERALAHTGDGAETDSLVDGVNMVYRQILTALEKHGITGFEAHGERFDPEHHEAIQQVETTDYDTGMVVEQFQKGYFIHDRLLRPALVSVAKRVESNDNHQQADSTDTPDGGGDGNSA